MTKKGKCSCLYHKIATHDYDNDYLSYDVASESVIMPCIKNDNQVVD